MKNSLYFECMFILRDLKKSHIKTICRKREREKKKREKKRERIKSFQKEIFSKRKMKKKIE